MSFIFSVHLARVSGSLLRHSFFCHRGLEHQLQVLLGVGPRLRGRGTVVVADHLVCSSHLASTVAELQNPVFKQHFLDAQCIKIDRKSVV